MIVRNELLRGDLCICLESSRRKNIEKRSVHMEIKGNEIVQLSQSKRAFLLASTAGVLSIFQVNKAFARGAGNPSTLLTGDWSSPGLAAPEDPDAPKFFKTADGVGVQELTKGKGEAAKIGDSVLIDFVLRRANGYFIYSTIEGVSFQPKDIPTGATNLYLEEEKTVPGLISGLVGMQKGGRRRILVPPRLGYLNNNLEPQMPTFATRRQLSNHINEPLLFEVELIGIIG